MSKSLNIPWILAIGWMATIFYLSHQPGEESGELSSIVAAVFSVIPLPEDQLHYLVRKGAHVFAYFLLAILFYSASRKWYVALVISVIYAMSDEFHQKFIPGRSGQISDVGIDSLGVILGVFTFAVFYRKKQSASSE
ncbi:VanZ family protein [Salimicrobium halophilum]|uniref:VanZ like family protein n=1 Tax=Salimicrobium halophilum TaxID=86666 RepID=A0A1G8S6U6_9BACI|nr:VanZ family protein [Salimicrobium halophilum]SDJ24525.1 VanZ like family protein [Salimicrobium halophilum]